MVAGLMPRPEGAGEQLAKEQMPAQGSAQRASLWLLPLQDAISAAEELG